MPCVETHFVMHFSSYVPLMLQVTGAFLRGTQGNDFMG